MTKFKKLNKLDYFNGRLAINASYSDDWDMPVIRSSGIVPKKVITFSKALHSKEFDCWVVFYEDDSTFERLWKNPEKYLPILKKFAGVVGVDFSLYGDYPLAIQMYNVYRSRLITHWLIQNGVYVIPNVRWSTKHTFQFCFEGLIKNDILFIGTHGCSKRIGDKKCFTEGLKEMVKRLSPKIICVYGPISNPVFNEIKKSGIKIMQFDSEFAKTHRRK